jgi:hypothetical protein
MLKTIYSTNIQILNGAIQSQNFEYLPLVISSMEVILAPYNKGVAGTIAAPSEAAEPIKHSA